MFFTEIHQKQYNEMLFSLLYKRLKENNHPKSVNDTIKKLESLIMNNSLYIFMQPEKHYSLLHGDYIPQNLKANKNNELPFVFDWALFTIGPRFIDIARFLS